MKKLFGREKVKSKDNPTVQDVAPTTQQPPIATPIHRQRATYTVSLEDENWQMVTPPVAPLQPESNPPSRSSSFTAPTPQTQTQQPLGSPGLPPPRSPSPSARSAASTVQPQPSIQQPIQPSSVLKKKQHPPPPSASTAIGILSSLDPTTNPNGSINHEERDKKKPFLWGNTKRSDDGGYTGTTGGEELTRMIGYLTATASEDWSLVLEVCEKASLSESNAKEAVKALRREFKYGEPPAQLSAARLWAIMLRNSSENFISQSTSRKFLDTLEDLLLSPRTSPVVRERVMDVLAAAAYASGSKKDAGFRGLWRRVKPHGKPEDGVPFDTDDAMFNPPLPTARQPTPVMDPPIEKEKAEKKHHKRKKSPRRNRIIPPDEDIRRLFQECKIGQGNAALLAQALVVLRAEDIWLPDVDIPAKHKKTDGGPERDGNVVREFYLKCQASYELISGQIPWATSNAERSRAAREKEEEEKLARGEGTHPAHDGDGSPLATDVHADGSPTLGNTQTVEEMLLGAILSANAELLEAIKGYEDLERVATERRVESLSKHDVKMDRRHLDRDGLIVPGEGQAGSSGSREHSPTPSESSNRRTSTERDRSSSPAYHDPAAALTLAPPPLPPIGPRNQHSSNLTAQRTPSPGRRSFELGNEWGSGRPSLDIDADFELVDKTEIQGGESEQSSEANHPAKPSAKALGKRRVEEAEDVVPHDRFLDRDDEYSVNNLDSDSEDSHDLPRSVGAGWPHNHPGLYGGSSGGTAPRFVYDAAAERTQQRIREGHNQMLVNGVH